MIRLIFDEFDRWGSLRGVMRHLQTHDIKLPIRPHKGPSKGLLEWRRPTREIVRTVLTHHLYAGTYRFGHRQTDPRRKRAGRRETGRVVVKPDRYHALIPDHCPAYITRERYDRNQGMIQQNRIMATSKGPAREGAALLGGILFCGACLRRMAVHYPGVGKNLRYVCSTGKDDVDVPRCQSLSGKKLDELITQKIMVALQPAALELSLQAADDLKQERLRLDQEWRHRLERGRFEVDRTRRQYQAVEPENRLVARELERQWEQALQQMEVSEKGYARFRQTHPVALRDEERLLIRSLAENLPTLWNSPTTSTRDKQRIVRLLIERVVVHLHERSDRVDVALHWSGGFASHHELVRPVTGYEQMADHEPMASLIETLRDQGRTFTEIADHLNREGFRPAQRAERFHKDIVSRIFRKLRNQRPRARAIAKREVLGEHEWFALSLADHLKMPKTTILEWVRRGWVHVTRQLPGYRGRKICWADADEIDRLTRLRDTKRGWWDPPLPASLTTPKIRPDH